MLRLSENGPIGRRMFTESRLQLRWSDTSSASAVELPTIRVNDAFTSGGAQRKGGQHNFDLELATDLDYVRGAHSWRTGVLVEGGRYRSDDISNYLGTYTFASLEAYDAGRPSNFSKRIGDPNITYTNYQVGFYVQDDWRVSRNLLLSPGVRFGVQTHAGGALNVSPRVSAAWSPLRNGSLTVRGSYGDFYDWIAGEPLQADAAGRRRPPPGHQHRQPVLAGPGRGRRGGAVEPVPVVGRPGAAARAADERRRRPGRSRKNGRAERDLFLRLGPRACCAAAT